MLCSLFCSHCSTREGTSSTFLFLTRSRDIRHIFVDGEKRQPGRIARLVWSKCAVFQREVDALLEMRMGLVKNLEPHRRPRLVNVIQWLTHHHAADFRRRVTEVQQQLHHRLSLICKGSSRIKCHVRAKVCQEMIDTRFQLHAACTQVVVSRARSFHCYLTRSLG